MYVILPWRHSGAPMRIVHSLARSLCLMLVSLPLLAAETEPEPIVEDAIAEPPREVSPEVSPSEVSPAMEARRMESSGKDAPSRVARLSLTQGEVSLAPAGTDEWADAVLNRPLTSGDRVWVDRDARAEFQVGSAIVHLDQNSGFSFEQLDDDVMRMSLTDGDATVRVRRKLEGETIVVETPNASIALLHPGEYHIEVNADGDQTIVKARNGEAAVTGDKDSYIVRANEAGTFKGTKELTADMTAVGQRTAFESWANARDAREERSASSRHVSRDVVGYEDLDEDGDWISEPEYGYVWTPRYVHAGWAPYRDGRWAWVSPWGWTWVDNARWGFAPFHYGRWAYLNSRSRWCWVPGPRHARPIYAPALVGWVGSPGLSVSVGFGSGVGWFPLGPREVYVPGYWHSRRYIHNVNFNNTFIVNDRYITDAYRGRRDRLNYRYRDAPRAVTIVPRNSFVGGRSIGGHLTNVSQADLRRWHHDPRPPAIAPDHGSVFAGNRSRPGNDRNERFARAERQQSLLDRSRSFAGRVPFDTERRAIEANGNRPVTRSQLFTSTPIDRRDRGDRGARNDGREMNRGNDLQRGDRQGQPQASFNPTDSKRTVHYGRQNNIGQGSSGTAQQRDNQGSNAPGSNVLAPQRWRDGGYRNRNNTDSARGSAAAAAPPAAEETPRRNSWRTNPSERTPRFENTQPSFDSVQRNSREDRSSQRAERQREARQFEPRVQASPAQESRPAPAPRQQQQAPERPQRAWRGNGDQGGGDQGSKRGGNNRNMDRQSQK